MNYKTVSPKRPDTQEDSFTDPFLCLGFHEGAEMANPVPQIWLHLPLNGTLFPELKGELRFGNQKHFHPHH